jgi:two-component system, NarL family, sensor histidine kinase DesK
MERNECVDAVSPLRRGRLCLAGGVWLLFLGFPLASLLSAGVSTVHLLLVLVGFGASVIGYSALLFGTRLSASKSTARAIVFALVILSILMTVFDRGGWAAVIVYAAAAMAIRRLFSERVAIALVLGFSATAVLLLLATGELAGTALTVGVTCAGVGMLLISFGELRARNVELLRARDERAKLAVAEERLRFARDMHDLLGHSLSVIALKAELAGRLLAQDAEAAAVHIGDLEAVARGALAEVRDVVSGYRRPDLAAELDGARTALRAAGIEAHIKSFDEQLSPEVEALLAWTVREGTTNVVKHSDAQNCTVLIDRDEDLVRAQVIDDGCGPRDGEASLIGIDGGHGLMGLSERAERLAGILEAGPVPQAGFRLSVSVPLQELQRAGVSSSVAG